MPRSTEPARPIVLHAARLLDVVSGEIREPGVIVVEGNRITAIGPDRVPEDAVVHDLGDVTLLPGLMDMEVNLIMGGADYGLLAGVQDDTATRVLRGVANAKRTLRAGFTTVRNLGLFVQTNGVLLDVALGKAIDLGWIDGPRIIPAGHAITPTGGHLEPTMFQALAPGVLPLTVQEGVADGVPEVRKAVRYQIKHGAQVVKVCASNGVMSHTGPAGAQQYSDEELRAVVDEAHRAGLKVAAHCMGDTTVRAAIAAGIDCLEHGFLAGEEAIDLMVENGTFLVATTFLTEAMDVSRAEPEIQEKAAHVFPLARATTELAIKKGVKIALGTDAPAIPHGRNAKELVAMVNRGMTPLQALRSATTVAAELISKTDRGVLEPGLLADIIAVPGNPLDDISVTEKVAFVMKNGVVYRS